MKFGTFLLTLVEPLLAKILISLGFSVVSIVGMEAVLTQVKTMAISNLSALGPLIDFALYLWLGKALGIVFAACTTKVALWQIQNATRILGTKPT